VSTLRETEKLIKKLNKEQKPINPVAHNDFLVVKRKKLYEEGRRLSLWEAYFIMLSVAVGIGYIQISNFFIKNPDFYWYPVLTCVFNIGFGYISI